MTFTELTIREQLTAILKPVFNHSCSHYRLSNVLKSSHQVDEEVTDSSHQVTDSAHQVTDSAYQVTGSAQTSSDLESCDPNLTSHPKPQTDPTRNLGEEHFETEISLSRLDLDGDPVPEIVIETSSRESSSPSSGSHLTEDLDRIEVESECESTSSKLGLDGVSSGNSSLRSSGSEFTGLPVPYNTEDR